VGIEWDTPGGAASAIRLVELQGGGKLARDGWVTLGQPENLPPVLVVAGIQWSRLLIAILERRRITPVKQFVAAVTGELACERDHKRISDRQYDGFRERPWIRTSWLRMILLIRRIIATGQIIVTGAMLVPRSRPSSALVHPHPHVLVRIVERHDGDRWLLDTAKHLALLVLDRSAFGQLLFEQHIALQPLSLFTADQLGDSLREKLGR
jgi:hypothetical protein